MSAITVSAMPLSGAMAAASRSTPVTRQPRAWNQRTCRPEPQATSSTPPPGGTRCDQRCTHADGASAECGEGGEGALIRHPPCCALRYSPWERPCGSFGILRAAHSGIRLGNGPAAHSASSVLRTPVFALGTALRLIGHPPCCALRYSPWERPSGSCRVLLVQRLERHAIDHAARDQLDPSTELALVAHHDVALTGLGAVDDQSRAFFDAHRAAFIEPALAGRLALRIEAAIADLGRDDT